MTLVYHLVRHDLRTHRFLCLAWLAIVVAHPLVAWLSLPFPNLTIVAVPLGLIASRIVLGAVAIGTILQADSPFDDRSFWRTRPISGATMAAAKLLVGALFVIVPLLVVLVVAAVVRVPFVHLTSTIAQVLFTDAAAVGLALLVATRTRTVASMLVALLGTLLGLHVLLVLALETLGAPWIRQLYGVSPPNVATSAPTLLIIATIATWPMTAFLFIAPTRRLRQLVIAGTATLILAIVWLVPSARLHRPVAALERSTSLSVDASTVRAERLESGRIAIVADGRIAGVQPGDRTRQYLLDGTLHTDDGPVAARQPGDLRFLRGSDGRQPVILGVLSQSDFDRLAGHGVGFQGRSDIEIARTDVIGTLPLAPGASLDVGYLRIRLRELSPDVDMNLARVKPLAITDITATSTWAGSTRLPVTQWWLRDGRDQLYVGRHIRSPFAVIGLLPTLARPFDWQRVVLTVRADRRLEPTTSAIEIEQTRGPIHAQEPFGVEFVVPTTVQPADVTRE